MITHAFDIFTIIHKTSFRYSVLKCLYENYLRVNWVLQFFNMKHVFFLKNKIFKKNNMFTESFPPFIE